MKACQARGSSKADHTIRNFDNSWGSASLHPRLYAVARSASSREELLIQIQTNGLGQSFYRQHQSMGRGHGIFLG